MKNRLIYLTGFMGAGKTTIGFILANTLGWDFIDLDKEIEKQEGKKIKEIFKEKGEKYFRDLESKKLIEISQLKKTVISLGGGTVANKDNLKLIKETGYMIYLKSSLEVIYRRLLNKRDRPVLAIDENGEFNPEKLKLRIREIFEKRSAIYEQADLKFNTDNIPIGKTVDHIVKEVKKRFNS